MEIGRTSRLDEPPNGAAMLLFGLRNGKVGVGGAAGRLREIHAFELNTRQALRSMAWYAPRLDWSAIGSARLVGAGVLMAQDALSALPESWRRALRRFAIKPIGHGMSDANLFRLRDDVRAERLYLKVHRGEAAQTELRNEVERTKWLAARGIMVPRFVRLCEDGLLAAVLMTALPGRHPQHAHIPLPELIRQLAEGLRKLHSIPASDCPFDETVRARLARARSAIAEGLVDPDYFSERNQGLAPQAIYTRLMRTVPEHEDIVVVHGDATFDNLLIDDAGNVGFIDCGHTGRGDRYLDLATMVADIDAYFGPDCIPLFARSYGHAAFDERKLGFFTDLYELF